MTQNFARIGAVIWGSLFALVCSANSPLMPADLLIANVGYPSGVFQYRGNDLVQTLTANPGQSNIRGASPTPNGKVVSTWENLGTTGLALFDPVTGGVATISTPRVVMPGDVSVTATGDYVICDQWGSDIDIYSQFGSYVRSLTLPSMSGERAPMGNTIANDGTIWVTMARREDILHYSSTGTFLGSFQPGFNPGDIVVDPVDGTLWFPDINSNRVHHFSASGLPISSFETAIPPVSQSFMGIAMTGNGWLYAASSASGNVYLYKKDGALVGVFSLSVSPFYINFISSTVPEPSCGVLFAFVAILLGVRTRRAVRN